MSSLGARQRSVVGGRSVVWHLGLFAAALVVPALVLLGVLFWRATAAEHERLHREVRETAVRIAADLDRELRALQGVLTALATARSLRRDDYATFLEQAREVAEAYDVVIVLREPGGRHLVNTAFEAGQPLPHDTLDVDRQVIETGRPAVTGLFTSPATERPVFAVVVPVVREGSVIALLQATVPNDLALAVLLRGLPDAFWAASLADRNMILVARSRDNELWAGEPATDQFRRAAVGESGTWDGPSHEGTRLLGGFARSQEAGWYAAVGVDRSRLAAPVYGSLATLVSIAVLLTSLSVLLAFVLGRRLTGSILALTESAAAFGKTGAMKPVRSPVREVSVVSAALADAATALAERNVALRESAALLDALMQYLPEGITIASAPDVTVERVSAFGLRLIQRSQEEVTRIGAELHPQAWQVYDETGTRLLAPEELPLTRATRFGEVVTGASLTLRLPDGTLLPILCNAGPIRSPDGRVTGGVAAWRDITEVKRREEQIELVMHELSHRSKNLLAVVQAIVRQTARNTDDMGVFQDMLAQRIAALASAHDLLVARNWAGAPLRELIETQLTPFVDVREGRVVLDGPDLLLSAAAAQSLALAMHELATNAVKYGALSGADGRVEVRWSREASGAEPATVRLSWSERGGPPVVPPARRGFGSFVLGRMAGSTFGGSADLRYEPDGVVWQLATSDLSCFGPAAT